MKVRFISAFFVLSMLSDVNGMNIGSYGSDQFHDSKLDDEWINGTPVSEAKRLDIRSFDSSPNFENKGYPESQLYKKKTDSSNSSACSDARDCNSDEVAIGVAGDCNEISNEEVNVREDNMEVPSEANAIKNIRFEFWEKDRRKTFTKNQAELAFKNNEKVFLPNGGKMRFETVRDGLGFEGYEIVFLANGEKKIFRVDPSVYGSRDAEIVSLTDGCRMFFKNSQERLAFALSSLDNYYQIYGRHYEHIDASQRGWILLRDYNEAQYFRKNKM